MTVTFELLGDQDAAAKARSFGSVGIVPTQVLVGSPRHGVVEYAEKVAAQVESLAGGQAPTAGRTVRLGGGTVSTVLSGTGPIHVHVTDRLFGDQPAAAADWIEAVASRRPVTVTLHDLPQPSDGAVSMARRADAYRRIVQAARGTACNSIHEARLLAEHTVEARVHVIPLAVTAPAHLRGPLPEMSAVAGVLGFIYPGKGHSEIIEAVAAVGGKGLRGVTAIGGPAPGHEPDLAALHQRAAALSTVLTVTGYLPTEKMIELCRRVAVPVAAHQHVSASASINTWVSAGRRPLVPDTRYFREMDALRPGTLRLYPPDRLAAALRESAEDPRLTWIAADTEIALGPREVAAEYLRWWSTDVRW